MNERARMLQDILEGNDGFIALLGIEFIEAGKDYAVSRIKIERKHMNANGTVQGGCLYAMADSTGVASCASDNRIGPTLNGQLYFTHSTNGASEIFCRAQVVKNGRTVKIADAVITDDSGREIARGTFQYFISQTIENLGENGRALAPVTDR